MIFDLFNELQMPQPWGPITSATCSRTRSSRCDARRRARLRLLVVGRAPLHAGVLLLRRARADERRDRAAHRTHPRRPRRACSRRSRSTIRCVSPSAPRCSTTSRTDGSSSAWRAPAAPSGRRSASIPTATLGRARGGGAAVRHRVDRAGVQLGVGAARASPRRTRRAEAGAATAPPAVADGVVAEQLPHGRRARHGHPLHHAALAGVGARVDGRRVRSRASPRATNPVGKFVNDQRGVFTFVFCTETVDDAIKSRAAEAALWYVNAAPKVFSVPRTVWTNLIRGNVNMGAAKRPRRARSTRAEVHVDLDPDDAEPDRPADEPPGVGLRHRSGRGVRGARGPGLGDHR